MLGYFCFQFLLHFENEKEISIFELLPISYFFNISFMITFTIVSPFFFILVSLFLFQHSLICRLLNHCISGNSLVLCLNGLVNFYLLRVCNSYMRMVSSVSFDVWLIFCPPLTRYLSELRYIKENFNFSPHIQMNCLAWVALIFINLLNSYNFSNHCFSY